MSNEYRYVHALDMPSVMPAGLTLGRVPQEKQIASEECEAFRLAGLAVPLAHLCANLRLPPSATSKLFGAIARRVSPGDLALLTPGDLTELVRGLARAGIRSDR